MKKSKVLVASLCATLAATAAIGGTMAYFTDTKEETNTFTVGSVKIDLDEKNSAGDKDKDYQAWLKQQKLIPTTEAQKENTIDKIVTIKNVGDNDAYVWVEAWIPDALDDPDASKNSLHFNFEDDAVKFEVLNGGVAVDSYVGYKLYVDKVFAPEEETPALMTQVYMDSKVTQCTDEKHGDKCLVLADKETHYTGSWDIKVKAIGIQADSFNDIEDAMKAYYAENPELSVPEDSDSSEE